MISYEEPDWPIERLLAFPGMVANGECAEASEQGAAGTDSCSCTVEEQRGRGCPGSGLSLGSESEVTVGGQRGCCDVCQSKITAPGALAVVLWRRRTFKKIKCHLLFSASRL